MRLKTRMIPWLVLLLCLSGCVFNFPIGSSPRQKSLYSETLVKSEGFWTVDKVLLVSIDGPLTDGPADKSLLNQASTLVEVKDILKKAEKDSTVKTLLLRINTPGGSVTASDLIYNELKSFKEKTGKKVVSIFMDYATSGGYYVAMSSDRIVANPTTVTGSIGVVLLLPGIKSLSDKIGFDMRIVKSGKFKDSGSPWRSLSPEDQSIFQSIIDSMYGRFLGIIARGRPNLTADKIRELADGRVYNAQQAKDAGLIDQIGYVEDAFKTAKEIAGIQDASLITYKRSPLDYKGHYYAQAPQVPVSNTEINIFKMDAARIFEMGEGPFYYLWLP